MNCYVQGVWEGNEYDEEGHTACDLDACGKSTVVFINVHYYKSQQFRWGKERTFKVADKLPISAGVDFRFTRTAVLFR